MMRPPHILALLAPLLACLLAACASTPDHPQTTQPQWAVPFAAATYHTPASRTLEDTLAFSRPQKTVYGPTQLGDFSAFSTYTYDAIPIGTPEGVGYRYRRVFRQGVTLP